MKLILILLFGICGSTYALDLPFRHKEAASKVFELLEKNDSDIASGKYKIIKESLKFSQPEYKVFFIGWGWIVAAWDALDDGLAFMEFHIDLKDEDGDKFTLNGSVTFEFNKELKKNRYEHSAYFWDCDYIDLPNKPEAGFEKRKIKWKTRKKYRGANFEAPKKIK